MAMCSFGGSIIIVVYVCFISQLHYLASWVNCASHSREEPRLLGIKSNYTSLYIATGSHSHDTARLQSSWYFPKNKSQKPFHNWNSARSQQALKRRVFVTPDCDSSSQNTRARLMPSTFPPCARCESPKPTDLHARYIYYTDLNISVM